ncbi:hypothetical protein EDM58_17635 [Brevibacillus panacihumi]|uniref:Uncharacterized protein n=1 Tax=Brevibacillus panacihumi TaxID=497735 RepID=A0A3M8CLR6_9BACL|nr:hypothetical protein EDM58_17635 [Brevibacillus panacihumi]
MDKVFRIIFGCVLLFMFFRYLRKRKRWEPSQSRIVGLLYLLTFLILIASLFPNVQLMPINYINDYFSPQMKMWVKQS